MKKKLDVICEGIYKGQCCCKCRFHHPLFSHPWIDHKPISHQDGWICLMPEFEGRAVKSKEHGMCECFTEGVET